MQKTFEHTSFIIFDWDGTLMDSTARIVSAMQTTARLVGLYIPSEAQVKGIIGLSMQSVVENLFPGISPPQKNELIETYRHQYIEADTTPTPLFKGVLPLLHWLRSNQIVTAVATGKARAGLDRVMNDVDLHGHFEHSICADEAQSKPHPQMVEELMSRAGKTSAQTLVVGDSVHDLKMANNANVRSVGVTSGANSFDELQVFAPIKILSRVCDFQQWFSESHCRQS